MRLYLYLLVMICFILPELYAQQPKAMNEPDADSAAGARIFQLGEITITASRNSNPGDRVNAAAMALNNKMEVSEALNMLPGIHLTASGARNESMVTVRGFDLRQVPVYMDGIPVYVPYDGYVDLARFTTFDLSAIDVSKGYSSVLYGPNALGGAINLVSRKPLQKLEFDGSAGMINTNGYEGNINIGSKWKQFFIQGGYSHLHRDAFRMSSDFIPEKNEDGGQRDNSYRTDRKYNLKIGWTPGEKSEYVLGYINQSGEKGNPVYTGNDTLNSFYLKPRFWQWPAWNKETFYFISKTSFNDKNDLKARIYYDKFVNTIFSFDDATYSTMNKPSAFKSYYNDYTYGGSLEYGTASIERHHLRLALHYKKDVHREHDLGEPLIHFIDNTITLGVEDTYKITDKLIVIPGLSYSSRINAKAEDYNSSTGTILPFADSGASKAYNGQLAAYYHLNEKQKIGGVFSHKTRFATIKDRYSYRLGTAIPNPGLRPETADNYELNFTGNSFNRLNLRVALFYSKITDIIMFINNVEPGKSQMQNAGRAEYMGAEAAADYRVFKNMFLGVNYTYLERHNLTDPSIYFTDVPNTKLYGYIKYNPSRQVQLLVSSEYNSSRFSTSYGTRVGDFTLVNAAVSVGIGKYMRVETGVNNIFDKNYYLVEGFPEEGRNFFVALRFSNHP